MKLIILVAVACVVAVSARPETYTDKWDYINVKDVLDSIRLRQTYKACLLGEGRCSPEGKMLKDTLPEALENECGNCTPKQKEGAEAVLRFYINEKPDEWKQLATVYDPNNIYQARYKDKIDALKNA